MKRTLKRWNKLCALNRRAAYSWFVMTGSARQLLQVWFAKLLSWLYEFCVVKVNTRDFQVRMVFLTKEQMSKEPYSWSQLGAYSV